MKMYIHTEVW